MASLSGRGNDRDEFCTEGGKKEVNNVKEEECQRESQKIFKNKMLKELIWCFCKERGYGLLSE